MGASFSRDLLSRALIAHTTFAGHMQRCSVITTPRSPKPTSPPIPKQTAPSALFAHATLLGHHHAAFTQAHLSTHPQANRAIGAIRLPTVGSDMEHRAPERLRSAEITEGAARSPNRAMLRAVGFGDDDFRKPIVGVANAYSNITPCNVGLQQLADRAMAALRSAGTMPQIFGTITVSDGISMGTEGMKYSLVSREVIADSIETACSAQSMDGVLAIGGCDKNMPGAMIAIARMNIPAIFVYGGTIKPGHSTGAT